METLEIVKGLDGKIEKYQKAVEDNQATFEAKTKEVSDSVVKLGGTIENVITEVRELQAASGAVKEVAEQNKDLVFKLEELIESQKENFAAAANNRFKEIEIKHFSRRKVVATITTGNITSRAYESTLSHTMGMQPYGFLPNVRDILRVIPTATDYVQFPRAATPYGEGSFGVQTEGSDKAQLDYDWTMIDVTLQTIAGWTAVSRQALRNIPFLQEVLPSNLLDDLYRAENQKFGAELYAAATGVTTVTGFTGIPEQLIALIRNGMRSRFRVNMILVSPEVWAKALVFRPGTDNGYGFPGPVSVTPMGTVTVLGIPLMPVEWLTGGQVIAGDFSKAAILESEGLTLRQSDSHSDYFVKNLIVFLMERVEALAVFRPDAFIATALSLS